MRVPDEENDNRTIYCGNLSEEVTDEILYELFNQGGPVETIRRPKDQNGRPKSFAFIIYKHECSVPYAIELFRCDKLFNRNLNLNTRSTLKHVPVLDTHLSEFIVPNMYENYGSDHLQYHNNGSHQQHQEPMNFDRRDFRCEGKDRRDYRSEGKDRRDYRSEGNDRRDYRSEGRDRRDNRSEGNDRRDNRSEGRDRRDYRSEGKDRREGNYNRENTDRRSRDHRSHANEPNSWAEFNALKGRSSNSHYRNDLQSVYNKESSSNIEQPVMPDYNILLQMGQQMMLPGMIGLPGFPNMIPTMGLGPSLGGSNMFPSTEGKMNGGQQSYSDRSRGRRDNRDARDHPYNERRHSDYRDDHRRHDHGHSASHSSHDKEKRNRRSR